MAIIFAYFFDIIFRDFTILRMPLHGLEIVTLKIAGKLQNLKNAYLAGILLIIGVSGVTFICSIVFLLLLRRIGNTFEFIGEIYLIFNAFSISLPEKGSLEVYDKLYENNLILAKDKLSLITEKKIENISEQELVKTTIIATAQNTLHDFFSPVFYAFIGGGTLALLCRCSYIVYYTISRNQKFDEKLKFFPGHIIDFYNFLPSKLLYLFLPIVSGFKKIKQVFLDTINNKLIYSYVDNIPIAAFFSYLQLNHTNENQIYEIENESCIDGILHGINYMYRLSYFTMFLIVIAQIYRY